MDDINIHVLKTAIKQHKPFIVGKRGLCVSFIYDGFRWLGRIERGDILMSFSMIRVTADDSALSCETPGFNPVRIILEKYEKVTLPNGIDFIIGERKDGHEKE